MKPLRKLAAIMFTDIEGYSTMMQLDEDRAIAVRQRHREVLQHGHACFNGQITQYYGDGTLSIFQSAVEAVQCAVAMQSAFMEGLRIPVRIGLHLGDIVCDEDNVYGDGVNLASRIESLGIAGCVLVSDRIVAEIHNHPELQTISLGSYQFKNIIRQVEVFAMNRPGLVIPKPQSLSGKTEPVNTQVRSFKNGANRSAAGANENDMHSSIAVLPFVNMSCDLEHEHFGDCLAEEVLTALTHIDGLKVAARTCSFKFKGSKTEVHKIGEKLGVSTILEGCVRRQDGHLRVIVQLINVQDGFLIWSERFDRDADDAFAIQDDIARRITQKLEAISWGVQHPVIGKQPRAMRAHGKSLPYGILPQTHGIA